MPRSLQHLNGHLLCAVDVETTGLTAGFHDLVQVCVLPLNSDILPMEEIMPFYMSLKPKRPENADPRAMTVNKLKMADLITHGMEPFAAADLFEEWWEKLGLPFRKKIAPLGANYGFDKSFLTDWLGLESYEAFFDYHVRDLQPAALFLNDRAAFQGEAAPYPKVNVAYLASQLEVQHDRAHDALQDCLVEAECWRRMVKQGVFR